MLSNNENSSFQVEINDSTVVVLGGSARIGNTIMPFQGGKITFSDLAGFQLADSSMYRNSLLYLYNVSGAVDMTKAVSDPVGSIAELTYPQMPLDATGFGVGIFSLYYNGSSIDLISYNY